MINVDRIRLSYKLPFFIVFLIALILYVGFISQNFDANGLIEAANIELGGVYLFTPNHLLYRPVLWLAYRLLQGLGYTGPVIVPAQYFTAVFSAFGVALFWALMNQIIESRLTAALTTVGFATAWAQWVFSIDAYYITVAAITVIIALIFLMRIYRRPVNGFPVFNLSMVALFTGLSVLIWQANVCFIPFVVLCLAIIYRNNRKLLFYTEAYVLVLCGVFVGIILVLSSLIAFGNEWSPDVFTNWLLNYSGARLSIWGKFELGRIVPTTTSFIASIVPLNAGLGISDLRRGALNLSKLPSLVALLILPFLFIIPIYYAARRLYTRNRINWVILTLIGFVFYLPFILWWDPFETKWFVIPNIAIWCVLGLLWETIIIKWKFHRIVYAVFVGLISFATFNATIVSAHAGSDGQYATATCVSQFVKANDLHIELFWGWSGHLQYFYKISNFSIIDSIGKTRDSAKTIGELRQQIMLTQARGDQVYVVDVHSIPPDTLEWIHDITGLTESDLGFLNGEDVGVCGTYKFVRVAPLSP